MLIAVFLFGIFLIYLGKKTMRFETKHDPNYDLIPDEEVKKFWRWMSQFNIQRSRFYIYCFGPFLMAFSMINWLMVSKFNAVIPMDFLSREIAGYFSIPLMISLFIFDGNSLLIGKRYSYGSRIGWNKSFIIETYKLIEFHSINDTAWMEKHLKHPIGDPNHFYKLRIMGFKRIPYLPFYWLIGGFIWFVSWILLFVYFTVYVYWYNFC